MTNSQADTDGHAPRTDEAPAVSDDLLLDGVQHHSELALTALYERYAGMALSLAQSIVGDHARAENVVLDVFLRCWNEEESYDSSRGSVQAWLLSVTRRQAAVVLESDGPNDADGATSSGTAIGINGPEAGAARPLRERLLARVRGEDDQPPAPAVGVAGLTTEPAADPLPEPAINPFPEPAAPIPVTVQVVEPQPALRRAALEPIPSTRIPQRPRQRRIRLASLGWAVALLFVIAAGLFVGVWSATGPHASAAVELRARLPGGQIRTLSGATLPTAKARLFVFDGGKQAELAADRLPTPPAGRVYQLWFAEPGQPFKTGGIFNVDARGDTVARVTVPAPLERIRGISITEEPAGGSANPSGAELLSWAP